MRRIEYLLVGGRLRGYVIERVCEVGEYFRIIDIVNKVKFY